MFINRRMETSQNIDTNQKTSGVLLLSGSKLKMDIAYSASQLREFMTLKT